MMALPLRLTDKGDKSGKDVNEISQPPVDVILDDGVEG